MANWAYVPVFMGEGTPTFNQVFTDGIAIGYNEKNRDKAIIMSNNYTMGKIAYYNTGSTSVYNVECVLAIHTTEYDAAPSGSEVFYGAVLIGTTEKPVKTSGKNFFTAKYGDFHSHRVFILK